MNRCEQCGTEVPFDLQAMLGHICEPQPKPRIGIRRNFVHNCIVHPVCGLIWLVADTVGLLGGVGLKRRLVEYGERLHREEDGRGDEMETRLRSYRSHQGEIESGGRTGELK